jgi:hypothetical protein
MNSREREDETMKELRNKKKIEEKEIREIEEESSHELA